MNNLFKVILDTYLDGETYDNRDKEYHKVIIHKIPEYIRSFIDQEKYKVKGSCGSSGKSEVPWIGIFNKNITENAQKGIYIVYLFKADMSGVYLCLGQGVNSFDKYGKNKEEYMLKTANYFKDLTETDEFKKSGIDLRANNKNGKDYCTANVLSKYYDKERIKEYDLKQDLLNLLKIYDQIYDDMEGLSYDQIIENVLSDSESDYINAEEAIEAISTALKEDEIEDKKTLTEIEVPKASKKVYKKISTKKESKVDHIEKAKKDAKIGLSGEKLVLEHEIEKMKKNKRADLIDKIDCIAKYDEGAGYDIKSFDFDEDGNEYEIYIEVKTTEAGEKKSFYITANELKKMKEKKERYWIYRVSKVNKEPKFFKINGEDFLRKYDIESYIYIANLK